MGALALAGQVCLGLVFGLAGLQKLRHRAELEGVVANYRILPRGLVKPAARALPLAELTVGILLLAGIARPLSSAAGILLLGTFAWAMAVNLKRGRAHIDCGCHRSTLRQPLHWSLVTRNLVLAVLLVPGLAASGLADASLLPVGLAAGAGLYVLYLFFNALSAMPKPGPSAA